MNLSKYLPPFGEGRGHTHLPSVRIVCSECGEVLPVKSDEQVDSAVKLLDAQHTKLSNEQFNRTLKRLNLRRADLNP